MDLGQGIRKALAKLTGAALVDEKTVRELTRELQRVLITNDVNVKLVFELTKRIEERALREKPVAGLTGREHVVKVVYEELQRVLGGKFEPRVGKQKILLLGLYGQGKCVHPDTVVPLPDGRVKTIEEVYDSAEGAELVLEDGFAKELSAPFEVFSFDPQTLKTVKAKCGTVWKLKKTEPLYRVTVDNGGGEKISVTPEHPFFVLDNGVIKQKRADELRLGDNVALPRKLCFEEREAILDVLRFAPNATRVVNKEVASSVSVFAREKFGTLEKCVESLSIKRPYCSLSAELKRGEVDVRFLAECVRAGFVFETPAELVLRGGRRETRFPTKLTPELAEFAGYVYGDGHLEENTIHLTNADPELVERFVFLCESLFGVKPTLLKEKRSEAGLTRISLSSKTVTEIFSKTFGLPKKKKSDVMTMPDFLLTAPSDCRKSFLRAYFDCDGSVDDGGRSVEVTTASERFAFQLRAMLSSLSINSSFAVKRINGTPYYRMLVGAESAERFASEISSLLLRKTARLARFAEIGARQTHGKRDNLSVGSLLKDAREYYGASIGDVQNFVSSYGTYESNGVISRSALRKFLASLEETKNANNSLLFHCLCGKNAKRLRSDFNAQQGWFNASIFRLRQQGLMEENGETLQTTRAGAVLLQKNAAFEENKLTFLQALADSDLNWAGVTRIEFDETPEYVYDLTIDETHNFVANNFVVHNTTTISKLAKFYQSKGLKVGVIAGDVHRPAAFEQLKQLAEQVQCGFYGENGEKDAVKVALAAEKFFAGKYDVLILDSAGRSAFDDELVAEIKAVNVAFKPDERFLVVSADLGQVAGRQASEFNAAVGLTGVIITKMDGSGKGGGALSSVAVSGARVAFIGTGEKPTDFEAFDSTRFVAQLCGFPDLSSLLDKLKEASDEELAERAMEDGKLDYESFLAQTRAMKKMGPMKQVMQMLGLYDLPEELVGQSEAKMKSFEAAVLSMTPFERQNPDVMKNKARQARVARGAGLKPDEVRELVNNFERANKMVKQFSKNRGLMKQLGKLGGGNLGALGKLGGFKR
ncbi:MAG: LAGLIDADG family homing endonuclease [Candidatus Micrarchaeota archaeon]